MCSHVRVRVRVRLRVYVCVSVCMFVFVSVYAYVDICNDFQLSITIASHANHPWHLHEFSSHTCEIVIPHLNKSFHAYVLVTPHTK